MDLIETVDREFDRLLEELDSKIPESVKGEFHLLDVYGEAEWDIESPEELEMSEWWLDEADEFLSEAEEVIGSLKSPLYEAHRHAISRAKGSVLEDLKELREAVRESVQSYMQENNIAESERYTFRDKWVAEVTDLDALVQAVANGDAPAGMLQLNNSFANDAAKTLQNAMQYPGVEAKKEQVLVKKRQRKGE